MNFKVLLRCFLISLLFCAPAPLLISLFVSFVGGELSRELLAGLVEVDGTVTLYLTAALAVFVVLFFATLAISLLTPKPVNLAEVENDDRDIGEVKWFNINKGYGFITGDNGEDVFVHFRAIRGQGHRTLAEGQRVRYYVTENDRGLQADDVTVIT